MGGRARVTLLWESNGFMSLGVLQAGKTCSSFEFHEISPGFGQP